MVFRRNCLTCLNEEFVKKYIVFDYSLKIMLAIQGGVYIIKEAMSVYRVFASSSWTTKVRNNKSFLVNHHLFAIETMKQISLVSDKKYENVLREEILRRETEIAILECNLLKMIRSPWRKYFCEKTTKEKSIIFINTIFPFAYKFVPFIYKLKNTVLFLV